MPNYAQYVTTLQQAQQTALLCAAFGICLAVPLFHLSPGKRRAYVVLVWYASVALLAFLAVIVGRVG